jgi:DNA-binding transcriptional regulator YiaG
MPEMKDVKSKRPRLGERLVAEFSQLRDALRAKEPIEQRFTVKTVELDLKPKAFDAEAVRVLRLSLGVSQAVFAHLLDVSVDLVCAWEQGNRRPSGPVCRLLEMMELDPAYWLETVNRIAQRRQRMSRKAGR